MFDLKGVYIIKNKITGKFYIGSTCNSFARRFSSHKHDLRKGIHKSKYLQRSFDKHGEGAFLFWPIKFLSDPKVIRETEQLYIDVLKPQYNTAKYVDKPMLGRKLSEAQVEAVRQRMKGRTPWNKGKPFSIEVRMKMSKNGKGKGQGKTRPKKPSTKSVLRDDGQVFKNTEEAARAIHVKPNTITKSISDSKCRRVKGFRFCYLDNPVFKEPAKTSPTKSIHKNGKEFVVRFKVEGSDIYLGRFKTIEDATIARNEYLEQAEKAKGKK